MMKKYRINEIFYSLQGEGFHTGRPATFIRFSGCNRRCDFCDTDFADFVEMSLDEIMAEIAKYPSRHVVLTGGEPTLQVDNDIVRALRKADKYIQIETNGSNPVPDNIQWVTCSPKEPPYRVQRISELKIVFRDNGKFAETMRNLFDEDLCYLQPCSGENVAETVAYILEHPWWKLSLQTHKLIDIK